MYLSPAHLIAGYLLASCFVSLPLTGVRGLTITASMCPPFYCKLLRLRSLDAFPSQITLLELLFLLHQVSAEFIDRPLRSHPSAKIDIYAVFRRAAVSNARETSYREHSIERNSDVNCELMQEERSCCVVNVLALKSTAPAFCLH